MIKAENLVKSYHITEKKGFFKKEKKTVNAVNGVTINIEKGKIVGLIGVNGAGKTTIIKMLSTILSNDEGEIIVDGLNMKESENEIKSKLNVITSGDRGLYWQLSAIENLMYFGSLYEIKKEDLLERINHLLDFVDLKERANEPIERFSKGMKQRLQIARGLINNPDYILMDEPTVGLDLNIAKVIRNKTKELAREQNKGILLTTHYITEIEELCDYVYVLDKGRIVCEGTKDEIIKSIMENDFRYSVKIEEDFNDDLKNIILNALKPLKINLVKNNELEIVSDRNIANELFKIISNYTNITSFSTLETSLEDAILKLMEGGKK